MYLDINYCQSLKWSKKNKELEKELKKFDISSLSPKYKVAVYALESNKEKVFEDIEQAIRDGLVKEDFMTWPLFNELREMKGYEEKIDEALTYVEKGKKELNKDKEEGLDINENLAENER